MPPVKRRLQFPSPGPRCTRDKTPPQRPVRIMAPLWAPGTPVGVQQEELPLQLSTASPGPENPSASWVTAEHPVCGPELTGKTFC